MLMPFIGMWLPGRSHVVHIEEVAQGACPSLIDGVDTHHLSGARS